MKFIKNLNCQSVILSVITFLLICPAVGRASLPKLTVRGAVEQSLDLTLKDLQAMPKFCINAVCLLEEKQTHGGNEKLIDVVDYGGVLLRDILVKSGLKYKRKWEPAVIIRVRGTDGKEVVFSFGEIFYSSIGRSTLVAYQKNGDLINRSKGLPELIVSNDIRNGRRISMVNEIVVERVNIEMKVYEERKKNIVQPPTTQMEVVDPNTGKVRNITLEDLVKMPKIKIHDKVQVGDCEGFHGVYTYEGTPLRYLLEKEGLISLPYHYDQYVSVGSKNGFCATYSIGELFNSKLGNNIIIAYQKDGDMLKESEGFAMMVVAEDSTGGRSVKRISNLYVSMSRRPQTKNQLSTNHQDNVLQ